MPDPISISRFQKPAQAATHPALERHYSVQDVQELWGLSARSVIRHFEDEPGCLKLGSPGTRLRQPHVVLRIPESVLIRVHTRLKSRAA